jgi:signal transduction histidine kinase
MFLTEEAQETRSKRIKILQDYNVFNLVQDDVLDDILQLAMYICEGTHAAIAFVDFDEQWLKAATGIKVEKLPIDSAVDVLLLNDIQCYDDLQQSEIKESTLLQKYSQCQCGISAALKTQVGDPLGYLLVLSDEKKPFSDKQLKMLKILARQTMAEVTLKLSQKVQSELVADLEFMQQELQVAKEVAEAANTRKSRVLAYVSHELKNPLNATMMFGNFLDRGSAGKLSDTQAEYVKNMLTGCQHLREVMSDLLEIAPVEAGLFKLKIKPFHLHDVIADVVTLMNPAAEARSIKIESEIDNSLDLIEGDARRIRQVIINLLSNAIKYTVQNDIICVKTMKSDSSVQIIVQDHGPGIAEADIQQLFQDYYRVQNHLQRQQEGLGLGLALSKKLVELHQGRIWVESSAKEGTRFIVEIPQKQSA